MIIVPKERPVIARLNSYYVDVPKLFEHYQGELGAGGIHFKGPGSEGIIFFDKDEMLNAVFRRKGETIYGREAAGRIFQEAPNASYEIDVYRIDSEQIYFWANIPSSQDVYRNLTTDFTDLEGLIRKMRAEKLTGFIDVAIDKGMEGGLILFNQGEIIGGSYSWARGNLDGSIRNLKILIKKSRDRGGVFQVCRIPSSQQELKAGPGMPPVAGQGDLCGPLADLLAALEGLFRSNRKFKKDFGTVLRKKFVEKADRYAFLDPFAGEFRYANQEVVFTGRAAHQDLVPAVMECALELACEYGMDGPYRKVFDSWRGRYANELAGAGVEPPDE
ncbi:MAG: hypothetical protein JRF59_01130 [Deltaproteobacteria bacterium]|nr:hypothetical protein [Deltaproteobacteria bacterium]MBW1922345.1 hypothetical protein [Deltaproteobacteria bacterium]MBW1948097.1 hypothetical protein [Deltaproteobacteria bacterium]MBW2006522.1 hypothetical protein [Deltaproteobacteria bacterium]MBW2101254.1 hypothetical protein [Deltaproteobacteria bacterium]